MYCGSSRELIPIGGSSLAPKGTQFFRFRRRFHLKAPALDIGAPLPLGNPGSTTDSKLASACVSYGMPRQRTQIQIPEYKNRYHFLHIY